MDEEKEPDQKNNIQLTDFRQIQREKNSTEELLAAEERKRRVSIATASRLRVATLVVSWISVILLGGMGIATFTVSVLDHSSASFAFALTAILDCLSSIVVIWRFASVTTVYSSARERAACIALAILFIASGISVLIRSAFALAEGDIPKKADIIWVFAIVNTITCLFLFLSKVYLAYKLESIAIATDSINSLIGFVLALTTLVGDLVYQQDKSVWYTDPIIGICCATFFFVYATWLLVHELKKPKDGANYEAFD